MLSRLRFALLFPLAALIACGGSSPSSFSAGGGVPTGDYAITIAAGTAGASMFVGALTTTGTNVTGVFRYSDTGGCTSGGSDIYFSGSIANGLLTLTSSSFSGNIATFKINFPLTTYTSGAQLANGTASITGGACAVSSATAQAQYFPSFSGNWSGSLTGAVSGTISLQIAESAANADGQFPVTFAISFTSITNTSCNFSISGAAPISGLVIGPTLQAANSQYSFMVSAVTQPVTLTVVDSSNNPTQTGCAGTYTGTIAD